MAFSTDNIGKNCYINMSEDENVEDSLYGTIIGYYKDTDKNEEYYFVSINGNVIKIYDDNLVNIVEDGGGGSGTVDTALSPTSTNPVQNKAVYAAFAYFADIVDGKEDKPLEETVSEAAASITPEANTIYQCGELTSLTISNPPATGKYSIVFFSGATATTTVGIENFVAEANKRYKITVEDNYATFDSWDWEGV